MTKQELKIAIRKVLEKEGGAAGMKALKKKTKQSEKDIKKSVSDDKKVAQHPDKDYILAKGKIKISELNLIKIIEEEINTILDEKKKKRKRKKKKRKKAGSESSKESSLRDWFKRKGAKGKRKGWVDCNAPDGKGGYKSCGRSKGEKRSKYPACRPTPGACKERGKGKSWGKKSKKGKK